MKSLSLNEYESEVIPSSSLVMMEVRRLARDQGKPATVHESRENRWLAKAGLILAGMLGIYMAIHILIWMVR